MAGPPVSLPSKMPQAWFTAWSPTLRRRWRGGPDVLLAGLAARRRSPGACPRGLWPRWARKLSWQLGRRAAYFKAPC